MNTHGIVDRIEGDIVVVELDNGKMKDFSLSLFPPSIQAGEAVYWKENSFTIDMDQTKKLRKEIEDLMDDLFID
ncbi:DUF3006 domain-containing protein [Bacillus massilinigeriensis]|uniref:DUF3006 domain-containing protein n=1 Tax=Bacillus massilionigeriensis TaxID=1805475 RepID=UPI00096AE0A8|nr:DUF3006 domain-containing protein [Bacillus massilionigeriensis]